MSKMSPRRAQRRDKNEKEIIRALEHVGCQVIQADFVDLVVCTPDNRTLLIEVKDEGGVMKPNQVELFMKWRGEWAVVQTVNEALAFVESGIKPRAPSPLTGCPYHVGQSLPEGVVFQILWLLDRWYLEMQHGKIYEVQKRGKLKGIN